MKIAILLLIHEFTNQQKILIEHLSKDFDIYIHVDKRTDINPESIANLSKNIYVYKKYKVYWGHYNQIQATLLLFKMANAAKKYDRYIFISGADLPIKTNKQIIDFFEHTDKEYLMTSKMPCDGLTDNGGFDRIDFFHARLLNRGKHNPVFIFFARAINKLNLSVLFPILKLFHIRRPRLNIDYYYGWNWMDLTDNCVSKIITFLRENPKFLYRFKYTRCADEIIFQTIIKNYIKDINVENKVLRYIDWHTGPEHPRTYRIEDYNRIINSDCLFARKFNSEVDNEIINKIYEHLNS